jgi:biopolymer transport protein ExbD
VRRALLALLLITACKHSARSAGDAGAAAPAEVRVPAIRLAGLSAPPPTPTVSIRADGITIGPTMIVPLVRFVPAAKETAGQAALALPRLGERLQNERADAGDPPTLSIAAPADAPLKTVQAVLYTAGQAGYQRFAFLVDAPEGRRALVLDVPDTAVAPAAGAVQPVVAFTRDALILFSLSGLEGSLKAPLLTLPATAPYRYDLAALGEALAGIVARRWPGPRPAASTRIFIVGDRDVPYAAFIDVVAAVRQKPDGTPLFPDAVISAGL